MKALIEMAADTNLKFEWKENSLILDRILPVEIPHAYGFIPGTLAPDGDALDVFILSEHNLPLACIVNIEIRGVIEMIDNGEEDNKIIATLVGETIKDKEIEEEIDLILSYLKTYKTGTKVGKFKSKKHAIAMCNKYHTTKKQPLPNMWDKLVFDFKPKL